jgi:hypothetical protein
MCWGGVIIAGALKMKNLQSYGYALMSCIVAMLPCNVCFVAGIPIGIWAIIALHKPVVKEAMARDSG